ARAGTNAASPYHRKNRTVHQPAIVFGIIISHSPLEYWIWLPTRTALNYKTRGCLGRCAGVVKFPQWILLPSLPHPSAGGFFWPMTTLTAPTEFTLPRRTSERTRGPGRRIWSHAVRYWRIIVMLVVGAIGNAALAAVIP